jgi:prepilin signal peptidase PulO-like enzyme (type II secretory pathway)
MLLFLSLATLTQGLEVMLLFLSLATLTHVAIVDLRTRKIENTAVVLLLATALVMNVWYFPWGLLGFGILALPSFAKLIGFGDAKLMLGLGTLVGPALFPMLAVTFLSQYLFQTVNRGKDKLYPFAPALCFATAVVLLGDRLPQ